MTRKEFLDDMVAYYSTDPVGRRSINPSSELNSTRCLYRGPNGKKCAIGRHIPDEEYDPEMEGKGVCDYEDAYGTKAPASIAHLGVPFLARVQSLHDCDENWTATGLSHDGKSALESIQAEFIP